jgi:hypothetical protein
MPTPIPALRGSFMNSRAASRIASSRVLLHVGSGQGLFVLGGSMQLHIEPL